MKENLFNESALSRSSRKAWYRNKPFSHREEEAPRRESTLFREPEMEKWNDERLLRYMKNRGKCEACFKILYERYITWVAFEARKYVDQVEAEDLTQEFMLCLWKQLPAFSPPYCIRGFARRIIRNKALNMLRRQRVVLSKPDGLDDSAVSSGAKEHILNKELWDIVRKCLDRRSYRLVRMRFFEGLDYSEIATREDMPVGSVKRIQHETRTKLRRFFEKNGIRGVHY